MHEIPINWLAVIVAALIRVAVGAFWYSPMAFAPRRQKTAGAEEITNDLPRAVAVDAVGSLLMAFILLHAVVYAGANNVFFGAVVGAFNWLGFVVTVLVAANLYEQRSLRSAYISASYNLVALLLMGALLAVWR